MLLGTLPIGYLPQPNTLIVSDATLTDIEQSRPPRLRRVNGLPVADVAFDGEILQWYMGGDATSLIVREGWDILNENTVQYSAGDIKLRFFIDNGNVYSKVFYGRPFQRLSATVWYMVGTTLQATTMIIEAYNGN